MYVSGPKASVEKEVEVGSREEGAKASFWRAASILEVVGVWAIAAVGRTSRPPPKFSCPAMGDKEKNCCCITGSTDAATELVDNATLRRTFNAIQSLYDLYISQ